MRMNAMSATCPRCGFANAEGSTSCASCEAPLPVSRPVRQGERRQLTVMFCDLVGSVALSHGLDPEDFGDLVRSYQLLCQEAVERFEGYVADYLGDGVMAFFGYPTAHEDDAIRAVLSGRKIFTDLEKLNVRLGREKGVELSVRVAVHTGLVVVSGVGVGHKPLIVGDPLNIASRLQKEAATNTLIVSAATRKLIEGFFSCEDLGPRSLAGISEPMDLHRVVSPRGVQSRLDVVGAKSLPPIVGREREIKLLWDKWEWVEAGRGGQVVLLSGEAGIGKSRLVEAIKKRLEDRPHVIIELRSSPYHRNSPLHPVVSHFERWLGFGKEDSPTQRLDGIKSAVQRLGLPPSVVTLWANLLSVPLEGRYPPPDLRQEERRRLLETLIAALFSEAEDHPAFLVVEDLHWIDPTTLELLGMVVNQQPAARVLTVLTYRPDFPPPWTRLPHVNHLVLGRLDPTQAVQIVENVTAGRRLPPKVLEQVISRTDGVPLFVEELTKMVMESGILEQRNGAYELTGPLPSLTIPATLQDSLMSRLDKLGAVKEVAQLCATLGRDFTYELLAAVSPLNEARLKIALDRLVETEFVYQRGVPPEATFSFKHALIQDAAYQALLRSTREQYHAAIGHVLEERFPQLVDSRPELPAQHYKLAGRNDKAVVYLQRAGEKAARSSAYTEAVNYLATSLDLLETLPDTPERDRQELDLQIALSGPLIATKGYGAFDTVQTFNRANELARHVGDAGEVFALLYGKWVTHFIRSEHQEALNAALQFLDLASQRAESAMLMMGHRITGILRMFMGDLAAGHAHLNDALALYEPETHQHLMFRFGQQPGASIHALTAWSFWLSGYPDTALRFCNKAIEIARESKHTNTLCYALFYGGCFVNCFRRDVDRVYKHAREVAEIAEANQLALWRAYARILSGWAVVERGQPDEGVSQIQSGITELQATSTKLCLPSLWSLLIRGQMALGQIEQGLKMTDEALCFVDETNERYWEAELYRLRGELFQIRGEAEAAEKSYHDAVEIARRQGAKSLELRAAVSLCRLQEAMGRREVGHQVLVPVYRWFGEGSDTPDLREAKTLLEGTRAV
jgi:class 3 adenylate cyclase/predicted ATPase